MRTTRRARWGSIAVAALLLCGMTGGGGTPAGAQVGSPCGGGGSGSTTHTCSTTAHTTYTVPGSGTFGANECPFTGNACPLGTTPQVTGSTDTVTTTVALGPGTIATGDCQSQTFFVAAGTSNVNTNTHTETFVTCAAAAPNPVPTLSTWALMAMVLLMVTGGLLALRRRPRFTE